LGRCFSHQLAAGVAFSNAPLDDAFFFVVARAFSLLLFRSGQEPEHGRNSPLGLALLGFLRHGCGSPFLSLEKEKGQKFRKKESENFVEFQRQNFIIFPLHRN
jgi:hypothetical protein